MRKYSSIILGILGSSIAKSSELSCKIEAIKILPELYIDAKITKVNNNLEMILANGDKILIPIETVIKNSKQINFDNLIGKNLGVSIHEENCAFSVTDFVDLYLYLPLDQVRSSPPNVGGT